MKGTNKWLADHHAALSLVARLFVVLLLAVGVLQREGVQPLAACLEVLRHFGS